jgi:hypothetical protein
MDYADLITAGFVVGDRGWLCPDRLVSVANQILKGGISNRPVDISISPLTACVYMVRR